ncbi:MFS transporter [Saliterribacillus persicus]|uniref:Putative MFS family arabinose efflux permease n=1 Tax=Saliterribacillus persicus TaxID=930114 RepID=A0A368X4X8_9BACI|nr:MFS transporter [Saliterribacillus persicus]RCW62993.1 putative MFS family arabinose efflux permease [Saliterribacillus persicus]
MAPNNLKFWLLISFVLVSGFSQGMLLPVLAILLEQSGVPSSVNGLHATGLYIGVLIASPFMEKPLQKLGYKPIILVGGLLVFLSLALFPLWQALWFWFILRLLVGIGDHMLHFATQTWITSNSPVEKRGRNIALYGLFFSLGFSIGPMMTRLLSVHEHLPFIVSAGIAFLVWIGMFFIRNEFVEADAHEIETTRNQSSMTRFYKAGKIAWIALLAPFTYGILETSLHSTFPIYGLRLGYSVDLLAFLIPTFSLASLITQIPLGIWSDRIGRKAVLKIVVLLGMIAFIIGAFMEEHIIWVFFTFIFAGLCIGSLYSLGVSFMTDLLPRTLLPAGNILCGIAFSLGSISGPYLGGIFLEWFPGISFFYFIAFMLLLVLILLFKKTRSLGTIAT